jgi:hypothetical protein
MLIKKTIILVFVVIALITTNRVEAWFHIPTQAIKSQPTELERFLSHMAWRESKNTSRIVNQFGMMGKYQFSPSTVRGLGFNVSQSQFLRDSDLQDSVMVAYMRSNKKDLIKIINRYDGRVHKGVKITEAGMLAAAHLGGSNSVVAWFNDDSYSGRADANGTSIRNYMSEFSKYKLEL